MKHRGITHRSNRILSAGAARLTAILLAAGAVHASAAGLRIGVATADITPDRPVALDGQFNTRISKSADTPITATAVAIEAVEGGRDIDAAILLSCDIVVFRPPVPGPLRERLRARLPKFDPRKLVMTATHTHTAPVTEEGKYEIPKDGVMQPAEYVQFLADRLADVAARAWEGRRPGGVSWGLGHAVVGHNRRAVYADGTATMYGATDVPGFRGIEGGADPAIDMLFFWDADGAPVAACVNVECPAQEVEGRSTINADFWHDVRRRVRDGAGDLPVLGWPGACGDISPHRMYRKAAEERMTKLRGLTYTQELGRRIAREVDDVLAIARKDIRTEVSFAHRVEDIDLPARLVTEQECAAARREIDALKKKGDTSRRTAWNQTVIDRFESQKPGATVPTEVHVLRIGDVAIATNPFELFHDYGVQIRSRSRAEQTFVVELTCGWGRYLPTARAVAGGGYSAVVQSGVVGPDGGQVLVDRTLAAIEALWGAPAR